MVPRVPSPPTTPSTDHSRFPPRPPTTLNCWLSVGVRTDTLGAIEKPPPVDTRLPWPSSGHTSRAPVSVLNQSTSACPSPLKSPTPTTCHGGEHPEPQPAERPGNAMTLLWPSSSHTSNAPVSVLNQSTSANPSPLKSPTPTTRHGGEHPEPQPAERPGNAMTLLWPSSSHTSNAPVSVLNQSTSANPSPLKSPTPTTRHGGEHPEPQPAERPGNAMTLLWPSSSHTSRAPVSVLNQSTSANPSPLKSPTPTTRHGGEHPEPQPAERPGNAMTLFWPSNSHTSRPPVAVLNQSTSANPSPLKSPTPTTCHGGEHPKPQPAERPGNARTLPWPSSSHTSRAPVSVLNQRTSANPSPLKSPTPTTRHGGEHPEPQAAERTAALVAPFERSRVVAINDATNHGR